MNMHVKNALSRCLADINANVVPIGLELSIDGVLFRHQELHAGAYLFSAEVEEVGTVAQRNDQRVAGTYGIAVARAVGQFIASSYSARSAEQAGVIWVFHASV